MIAFYRALLRLYPASFRNEYGDELVRAFGDQLRDAGSPARRMALAAVAIPEVAGNALAVHAEILRQDLRYTRRTLARARGFALTAMTIIALGIGVTTAAFSIADFVLLRPLPFPDADRLVMVWQRQPGYVRMELAPANYADWRRDAAAFESSGAYFPITANLVTTGEPERVSGASVTADLLPTLGVRPALGRLFEIGEDRPGTPGTIVISDSLWRAAFGADPSVVGRTVRLNDQPQTVIGVMPPGFSFPSSTEEFWQPLKISPNNFDDRTNNFLYGVARLKAGATIASAQSEMSARAAVTRQQFPKEVENTDALVAAFREELAGSARLTVYALNGAALCVLLIVCANLANLLIARALGRRLELAVRTAMGAGRERLVRQLATESLVLALGGGAAGVALAVWLTPFLWRMVPVELPIPAVPGIDLRVLAFAAILTIVTALACGLTPLLRIGSTGAADGLREGARAIGGRRESLRGALVAAEVVASVVLLVVTGLFLRALWTVRGQDPGFRPDGVLALQIDPPAARYRETAQRGDFYVRVLDQIRALPGVQDAACISGLPMVWGGGIWPVGINGPELERRENNTASMRFTTPRFFATMQIPLRAGRDVSDADTMTSQMVAVVSESFVTRYWPGQDAVGRRFSFATKDRTVVGVVADVRVRGLERTSEPQVYLPYRQVDDGWFFGYAPKSIVVRATGPQSPLVSAVRGVIRAADPAMPIFGVQPMTAIVDRATASRQVQVRVLAGFALAAILLAAIGIHGVLSFAVSQRTAEIGVRVALGARRADILAMVARQGLRMVAAGGTVGLLVAYAAARWLQSLLAGVPPSDLATFTTAIALTTIMGTAGTLLPALRAMSVDPIRAIRAE